MATSLASQLQAIKSLTKGTADPIRRPLTRPSILYDPKEAADIDLRTILLNALSGLDALIDLESRFRNYKDTLFSLITLESDREKMVQEEENKLNKSIHSYLRHLSGYFGSPASQKTLEYLIRRYSVHVYNVDELVLCALPYHSTPAFVRIVQLVDLSKNKDWAFLEGVKSTGAAPPKKIIVHQCIRDNGVLEKLLDYASPKKFQHARTVIYFYTSVIVEVLGSISELNSGMVQRVLPFVFDGLSLDMKGSHDHKAGALMVLGLLATRVTLESKLLQKLALLVAKVAQHDAKQSSDLPWIRVTIMAIVTLVQSQSNHIFLEKTAMVLKDIRDFAGILFSLSQEFNIQKFLCLYLEALVDCSKFDSSCLHTLISTLETLQMKEISQKIVPRVLVDCLKVHRKKASNLNETVKWAKKILIVIEKHHPSELHGAVRRFLQENLKEEKSFFKNFCLMFDEGSEIPNKISDSKLWFSLKHPKADVRRAALLEIAASGAMKDISANPQTLTNIQESLVECLNDVDLTVVRAALSIGLAGIVNPSCLLRTYQDVLLRCIQIISGSTPITSQASDVAVLCLERMVLDVPSDHINYLKEVATVVFPLLLVRPKTWRVNLKALEMAKQLKWPFYSDSTITSDPTYSEKGKILESGHMKTCNIKTIEALAGTFLKNPQDHIQWLVECSRCSELAKSLFLFIILQASMPHNGEIGSVLKVYQACSLTLGDDWREMESDGRIILSGKYKLDTFDKSFTELVDQLSSSDVGTLNIKVHISIYRCLLKACTEPVTWSAQATHVDLLIVLNELFLLFAPTPSKVIFREYFKDLLVKNCSTAALQFLCKYFSEAGFPIEVQVESLHLLATICSSVASSDWNSKDENSHLAFLLGFSSLLIPLSSENKDIRTEAANCTEGIYKIWCQFDMSRLKNGNDSILPRSLSTPAFGEFLESVISQKKLISSDSNYLPSLFMAMFNPSDHNLLVPENINKRFDQATEDILLFMLNSALKFSSYGKLVILSLFKGLGNALLHVDGIKKLLMDLSERRNKYHLKLNKSGQELSKSEVEILCLLLGVCIPTSNAAHADSDFMKCLMDALGVDGSSLDDPAVVRPCIAVLENLTRLFYDGLASELQDELFGKLVFLFRNDNGDIRVAAKEALLRINFKCSNVVSLIDLILGSDELVGSSKRLKRTNILNHHRKILSEELCSRDEETTIHTLVSLLDVLLLVKKIVEDRVSLVRPLFQVLRKLFSKDWLLGLVKQGGKGSTSLADVPDSVTCGIYYAQQTALVVLKDITDSLLLEPPRKADIYSKLNLDLLVECARSTEDASTRNNIFSLLSSIAKTSPACLSKHMFAIFTVIGESSVKQIDGHSQHIMEDLISKLVPCWLSETNSVGKLLQIFIKALPDVAEHRRLTLMVYLLRSLGEKDSLGMMIFHLFHLLLIRLSRSSSSEKSKQQLLPSDFFCQWEYLFAVQLSSQYSCKIWFPSLLTLLQEIKMHGEQEEKMLLLRIAMQFILQKLEDSELSFHLEAGESPDSLQVTLGLLMEQIVLQLQISNSRDILHKDAIKELKDCSNSVLKALTIWMSPSIYFEGITHLLDHTDGSVKKKALRLLCETIRGHGLSQSNYREKRSKQKFIDIRLHHDESANSFNELCLKIVQLISCDVNGSGTPVKLAAISSLEVLSKELPSDSMIYATCLACIVKCIGSADLAVSSGCLRSTGALVNVLGPKALSQLPHIMKHTLERAHEISSCPVGNCRYSHIKSYNGSSSDKQSLLLSIIVTLETVIVNLSGFLNPYLEDILDLVMLHPEYVCDSTEKIKQKAIMVRKLLTEKIPVRLILTPLLKMYSNALKCGESCLCLVFEMLASIISVMDRSSIGSYHVKIYKQCLTALDIRSQHPESVKKVDMVEQSVIGAMIVLTMKLTESMFRPLFVHSVEWADSKLKGSESISLDRKITFYNLVNKLVEKHRSLFVPYFKYLLEDCTQHLTEDQDVDSALLTQKRKKTKIEEGQTRAKSKYAISSKQWHLRALILKSLYQCFLYDTTDLKFLDASNFQVLLKPIVSQIVVDPPNSPDHLLDIPTVEEVDESLVLCLGQMAVAAHSDVLWKSLNHEVLMQTRNERVRPKIIGLKVVKYLVEHLNEEYLVLLPETIPFLGELLEDMELPVKTLAQEILREMETLSGENLQQYL